MPSTDRVRSLVRLLSLSPSARRASTSLPKSGLSSSASEVRDVLRPSTPASAAQSDAPRRLLERSSS
eukprot:7206850-Prymnesium_polylepis.1